MFRFGASFSTKYAIEMGIDPKACLKAALTELGLRRLRLMSYWNQIGATRGIYDFSELDWQIDMSEKYGAAVTLCLGLRQPRWPESHWPKWARELPDIEWQHELMEFIAAVVERYKDRKCVVSYQLENEALLKNFGEDGDYDRQRLRQEFKLVKSLDPPRKVVMTTSDSWGLPFFGPRPDAYAFSIYRYFYDRGAYRESNRRPIFYRLRAMLIRLLKSRPTFIHELQAEPWGPKQTYDMPLEEQFKSMNLTRVKEAVEFAKAIGLNPIDIWGLEWWYWLKLEHDNTEIWDYMRSVYQNS